MALSRQDKEILLQKKQSGTLTRDDKIALVNDKMERSSAMPSESAPVGEPMGILGAVESVTAAPARSALLEGIKSGGRLDKAVMAGLRQVGEPPETAATGKQIVEATGIPDVKGSMGRPSLHEMLGTATEVVVDPTNLIGLGVAKKAPEIAAGLRGALETGAESRALKALGGTTGQVKKLTKEGLAKDVARQLLDEGAVPIVGTPKRILERVETLRQKAGQDIGKLLDKTADAEIIDGNALADAVLANPELFKKKGVPGREDITTYAEKYAETLRANGMMNIRELLELRQGVDEGINFAKRENQQAKQYVLYEVRTLIRDSMNDAVNAIKGVESDALKKANKKFSLYEKAVELLEGKVARDTTNRTVSLTDLLAGTAGATQGLGTGAALAVANKASRSFGNAAVSRGMDALAKTIETVEGGAELLSKNPESLPIIYQIMQHGSKPENAEKGPDVSAINRRLKGRSK